MEYAFEAFLRKISAKSLLLVGRQGLVKKLAADDEASAVHDEVLERLSTQVCEFDDGHFLHMEKAAPAVAQAITAFIAQTY